MAIQRGTLQYADYDTVAKTLTLAFQASDLPAGLPQDALDAQANGNLYPNPGTLKVTVTVTNPATTQPTAVWFKADGTRWQANYAGGAWGVPFQIDYNGNPLP